MEQPSTVPAVQTSQIDDLVKESGLPQAKGAFILEQFRGYFAIADEWREKAKKIVVTSVTQAEEMRMAREGRLFLKQKRVAIEKSRKALKDQALKEGQTIDAIAKILTNMIEPVEDYLERQEKFIEVQEEARKAALKAERVAILQSFNPAVDLTVYDLANMPQEAFAQLHQSYIEAKERAEAEKRKLEEERIAKEKAEAEERERMRADNERLRKEAEEREKQRAIERAKADEERRKVEEAARKEREANEKKLAAERAERERIAAELKAKNDAETKALRDKAEAEERAAKEKREAEERAAAAPDKTKLTELADQIKAIKFPEVKGKKAKEILVRVDYGLTNVVDLLRKGAQ